MIEFYSQGLFMIVNTLISFYIVIYAFIFLNRTKKYPDRRPWELLFIGAIFFLVSQVLSLTRIMTEATFFGIGMDTIKVVLEFAYITLILMAFITQSQMILMSDLILITKKVDRRQIENDEVKRKKKHMSKSEKAFTNLDKKETSNKEIKFGLDSEEIEKEMKDEHFESELKTEKELIDEDYKR